MRILMLLATGAACVLALPIAAGCHNGSHAASPAKGTPAATPTTAAAPSATAARLPMPTPHLAIPIVPPPPYPWPEVIYVNQAPPAPPVPDPAQGTRPWPASVWVPGYPYYNRDHYEWVIGHWEAPPRGATAWFPPRYDPAGPGRWHVTPGVWR